MIALLENLRSDDLVELQSNASMFHTASCSVTFWSLCCLSANNRYIVLNIFNLHCKSFILYTCEQNITGISGALLPHLEKEQL